MIELTDEQIQSLNTPQAAPVCMVNPHTKEVFVLLRMQEYEQLKADDYDDSPWTREELETLAWEAGKQIGWEEMDEYDHLPDQP